MGRNLTGKAFFPDLILIELQSRKALKHPLLNQRGSSSSLTGARRRPSVPCRLALRGLTEKEGRRRARVASLYLKSQPARHSLWSKPGAGRRGEGAAAPRPLPGAGSRSAQPPLHSWCGADPGSPIGSHDGSSQESPCPSQDRSGRGRPTPRGRGRRRKGAGTGGHSKAARNLRPASTHFPRRGNPSQMQPAARLEQRRARRGCLRVGGEQRGSQETLPKAGGTAGA